VFILKRCTFDLSECVLVQLLTKEAVSLFMLSSNFPCGLPHETCFHTILSSVRRVGVQYFTLKWRVSTPFLLYEDGYVRTC